MSVKPDSLQSQIKEIPARFKLYKVTPYKDAFVYIRSFDLTCPKCDAKNGELFEYLVLRDGQIYTDNIEILPDKKGKLTEKGRLGAFGLIMAAASSTVDELRGETVSGDQAVQAQAFIDSFTLKGDKVNNKVN